MTETTALPTVRPSGWSGGQIAAVAVGSLLALVAAVLVIAGGTALWADRTQRDGAYLTSDLLDFTTSGSALTTVPTELGSAGTGWLYSPGLLDKVRIRVTRAGSGPPLFVGIAHTADVDRYLANVDHTVITDFWQQETEPAAGAGEPATAPGGQRFWAVQASGSGTQTVEWEPSDGSWTVVVMNADGRPALDVEADLGARMPALPLIALGVLAAGVLFAVGGVLLIAGVIRRRKEA